jgi:hypothetical protein
VLSNDLSKALARSTRDFTDFQAEIIAWIDTVT